MSAGERQQPPFRSPRNHKRDRVYYADCYGSPDILPRYCATCPVGQRIGRTATDRPLPYATLRIRRLIADAQSVADRLEQILLQQLEQGISDIVLCGLGNEKAAPGATGAASR